MDYQVLTLPINESLESALMKDSGGGVDVCAWYFPGGHLLSPAGAFS